MFQSQSEAGHEKNEFPRNRPHYGKLFMVTGTTMVLPVICASIYREDDLFALVISAASTIFFGFLLSKLLHSDEELTIKDGIFTAFFGWIVISAASTLPFLLHGSIPSFTDAFFE